MLLDASGWSENPGLRAWRDALGQLMDTDWRGIRDRTSYSPERFTLLNLFDADISGRDFEHGKPHPMISLDDVAVNALSEARLDRATIR